MENNTIQLTRPWSQHSMWIKTGGCVDNEEVFV